MVFIVAIVVIIIIIRFDIFLVLDFISVFHPKLSHLRCCMLGHSIPYFLLWAEYHLSTAKCGQKSGLPNC